MNAIFKHFLLVSFLLAPSLVAAGDVWAEREALAGIESELSSLESLVMTAKVKGDSKSRTTFDYEVLLGDIRKIRSGIKHHLTVPMEPVVPSSIDALSVTYTEHQR